MRVLAFGRAYSRFLLTSMLRWGLVWCAACTVPVIVRIARGALAGDRAAKGLALAFAIGVALRGLQELFPRDIRVEDDVLVLHHSNWSVQRYPLPSISSLEDRPAQGSLRLVEMTISARRGKPRVVPFAIDQEPLHRLRVVLADAAVLSQAGVTDAA